MLLVVHLLRLRLLLTLILLLLRRPRINHGPQLLLHRVHLLIAAVHPPPPTIQIAAGGPHLRPHWFENEEDIKKSSRHHHRCRFALLVDSLLLLR